MQDSQSVRSKERKEQKVNCMDLTHACRLSALQSTLDYWKGYEFILLHFQERNPYYG